MMNVVRPCKGDQAIHVEQIQSLLLFQRPAHIAKTKPRSILGDLKGGNLVRAWVDWEAWTRPQRAVNQPADRVSKADRFLVSETSSCFDGLFI